MDLIEPPGSPFYDYQIALCTIEDTLAHERGPIMACAFTADVRALLEIAEVAFGILRHDEYCPEERALLDHAFGDFRQAVLPI